VYRHRCVEAWAMVVPWTGFQLSELLKLAAPLGSAKYVRFETAAVPSVMPGLRQSWYPWPYVEGCTIQEAANELSFMVVGAYGKPLPPQNGGPLRVHFPWKYGFKSGKSLVRVILTDERPKSFWEQIQPQEYGFWANVNPEVPHPRWSQASERMLGTGERVPTRIFNGYGEFVAGLYEGLQGERLWA
jgi:sulfoxide reductase catalytic subunit YedY